MSAELHRRLENVIRIGTIKTITPSKPFTTVTVQLGEITTGQLRYLSLRSGKTKTWEPPSVGEEVVVLSPSGVVEMGVVLVGLSNAENPAPSDELNKTIRVFEDGCIISYDDSTHILSAILPDGGQAIITASGGVTVNGDTTINGNLQINGSTAMTGNNTVGGSQLVQGSSHSIDQISTNADVTAGEISLINHKTSGVRSGSETSGAPIP